MYWKNTNMWKNSLLIFVLFLSGCYNDTADKNMIFRELNTLYLFNCQPTNKQSTIKELQAIGKFMTEQINTYYEYECTINGEQVKRISPIKLYSELESIDTE